MKMNLISPHTFTVLYKIWFKLFILVRNTFLLVSESAQVFPTSKRSKQKLFLTFISQRVFSVDITIAKDFYRNSVHEFHSLIRGNFNTIFSPKTHHTYTCLQHIAWSLWDKTTAAISSKFLGIKLLDSLADQKNSRLNCSTISAISWCNELVQF